MSADLRHQGFQKPEAPAMEIPGADDPCECGIPKAGHLMVVTGVVDDPFGRTKVNYAFVCPRACFTPKPAQKARHLKPASKA